MKQEMIRFKKNFPASKRIFKKGSDDDIAVPFRQIELSDTQLENDAFHNDPITVYDTAGPYHDDNYDVNIDSGIPQLRKSWIDARQDVESYKGRKIQSITVLKRKAIKIMWHILFNINRSVPNKVEM